MSLDELVGHYPPPTQPKDNEVDWNAYERRMGFMPPKYFRDFIGVYGDSTWFDTLRIVYTPAQSEEQLDQYVDLLKLKSSQMEGNIYSAKPFEQITPRLFPEEKGLLAIAIDFSSSIYCWDTKDKDPETWPIVYWQTGALHVFENATIDGLILDWINRKSRMVELFCDFNDVDPQMLVVG